MRRLLTALFLLGSALPLAVAGEPRDPAKLLDSLVGHWTLTGVIARKNTTHDVTAEWVLNRGYVQLHEVSREKGPTGAPAYEAIVFISLDGASKEFTCLWLDSTGNNGLVPEGFGHARATDSSIPFIFRSPDGAISFENTFTYDLPSATWTWTMNNVQQGKRAEFGRVKLTKS